MSLFALISTGSPAQAARFGAAASLVFTIALNPGQAHAQDKGGREREALRRVQQSLRQTQEERDALVSDKTALTQAKAQLDGQLKETSSKVKGAQAQAASARARAEQLQLSVRAKEALLAAATTREAELNDQLARSQAALAEKNRLLENVTGMLTRATQARQTLEAQNKALYGTGLDLLDLYRGQSPSTWLKIRDAAFGWHGIEVENVAEAMRTKLDQARYQGTDATSMPGPP